MHKLDERDIQILSILQSEGRITKTALADKLNLSLTPFMGQTSKTRGSWNH